MSANSTPLFSIITPVYNNTRYLEAAVNSVLTQDFSDFEYIIIDDGSTDGTSDLCDRLAESDSRITVIHQENQWIYASYNNGIKKAKGQYILILNSDDRLYPGILKYAASRLKYHDNVDVLWAIEVMNRCDENQNILEKDMLNVIGYFKEDVFFETPEQFRANWLKLYKALVVKNPVNFYKRELMLSHPFRNDIYGADLMFNINIAPSINKSLLLSLPAYEYLEYVDSDMENASGLKYYPYEHSMFNESYILIKDMLSSWNLLNSDSIDFLENERIEILIQRELYCINKCRCSLTTAQKVNRCLSYYEDSLIVECAAHQDSITTLENSIITTIREILINAYVASNGTDFELFKIVDSLLTMEKQKKSYSEISSFLNNSFQA